MKKSIYTYIVFVLVVAFSACENDTLELSPIDLVDAEQAFSTPEKIKGAVIGAYDGLQDADFLSGRALIYVDALGEDVFDRTGYFGDLSRFNMISTNTLANNLWTAGYNTIARANRVIEGVSQNSEILDDPDLVTNYIAEAKFIRAVSYFYLVNFFAQTYTFTDDASHLGVPLITRSFDSNDPEANQPRSSVRDIYQFIIGDLTACVSELPSDYGETYDNKVRGTQAAAAALLSRIYLYMGDYENARTFALNVMNGTYGTFSLNSRPNGAFGIGNYQTAETIWSIPNNATDNPNTNNALPQHYYPDGRGDLPLSRTYLNQQTNPFLADDDLRRTSMIINGNEDNQTRGYIFTNKYPDVLNRADWAPVIRYAEILLTYAEAQTQITQSVSQEAVDALNQVRDRSQVSAPSYGTGSFGNEEALLAVILGERRVELAFEGHRFWDLMRTHSNVMNKYGNDGTTLLPTQQFGADKNIFPIPNTEVDKSGGVLIQNSGY